ncbi:uncharacterized protein LOC130188915 isoform X2 [Pseudoliparis swirei]|uniref:uncharacterized protein LOC130188915 isoform X2 n=1 Tax=Pseudoliparis swirei TaxID=2059687 RepID=UPI0024BE3C66|nr:uncharacterized protein LOC130188915 isoform X2 [Pseudoliparis swirei]
MACGNKLVSPKLQEGQELNGMLIHKIFKTKGLYVRPSRTILTDSDEENECSNITTRSTLSSCATAKDQDDDCLEVYGSQIHTGRPSTTRVATRAMRSRDDPCTSSQDGDGNPGTGSGDEHGYGITHATRSVVRRRTAMQGSGTSGHDGGCLARSDGNPGTSGDDGGSLARSDGNPGTSGDDGGSLARSDGNPGTSGEDGDYSSYLRLMAALPDDSSDDEEFNQAIIASMESQIVEKVPVQEILLELSSKINTKQQCKFNINRSAVWEGAVRGFQRVSYNPNLMICVKFSDDMGRNEEGIDLGGPRREFLRLLMETMARSPMFEGKENSKNLALDSAALREDRYYTAGRAIAVSLVHGGPPPNFLSPTIFSLLVDGSAKPVLDDIADNELLEKVKKVSW